MFFKKYALLVLALSASIISAKDSTHINLIDEVTVKKNKVSIAINKEFKAQYLKNNFFAEYDPDINLEQFDYSVVTMPFIMHAVSIVWISGNVYYVDEMDTELYHSLNRVKKVFQTMYPKTKWDGELRARKLVDHPSIIQQGAEERTAALFSGGLDSTSTVFGHLDKKQCLITAWGHWDLPLHEHELWETRRKKTIKFAEKMGNEAAFVKSNYQSFLHWEYLSNITPEISKWRIGAVEGLGWAGLTAPILLSKGYPALRIASSHTWLYPYPSASSPYVDNNIKFCGLRLIHDQYDLTRVAKTELIARVCKEKNIKKPFLKICSVEKKNDKNCCNCRKCLSTIMGFFAIGEDPKEYGMPISLNTAWSRTRSLLAPTKLNEYTILLFKGIQLRIKARAAKGESIPKELVELAAINFDKKVAIEEKKQHRIDWNEMQPLLPELKRPSMIDGMSVR